MFDKAINTDYWWILRIPMNKRLRTRSYSSIAMTRALKWRRLAWRPILSAVSWAQPVSEPYKSSSFLDSIACRMTKSKAMLQLRLHMQLLKRQSRSFSNSNCSKKWLIAYLSPLPPPCLHGVATAYIAVWYERHQILREETYQYNPWRNRTKWQPIRLKTNGLINLRVPG